MKKLIVSLIILIIVIMTTIGIYNMKSTKVNSSSDGKLNIVASIYPVYDFAKQVAGDKANVTMLLSPGVEVHDYEPTPQDMLTIQNADLFLYLGETLEPWGETLVSGLDDTGNIKDVSKNIQLIENEEFETKYLGTTDEEESEHEKYDTHIWLDPTKAISMVENIADELSAKDPENVSYYRMNAQNYISQIKELDQEFENTVNNSENKEIAFGGPFSYAYFIERYNLKFVTAYDSCGENGEPSVDKIFKVVEEIKKNNLPVIFNKELVSGNIAQTISEETGAKQLIFYSLHTVTQEQLDNNETYVSIMQQNLENLKQALK